MLSNHKKGFLRDKKIIQSIGTHTALDADQIRLLHLNNISYAMACRILARLAKNKRLKRDRFSANEPYFYYTGKRPGQEEHVLGVSWIYVWNMLNLKPWEKMHSFEREIDYKILRADGFIAVKNTWTNKFSFYFIEFDIYESGNPFKKAELYNALYETEGYFDYWWAGLAERFPAVIVITTGNVKRIQEKVSDSKIEFQVYSLTQIKEECLNGSSTSSIRSI